MNRFIDKLIEYTIIPNINHRMLAFSLFKSSFKATIKKNNLKDQWKQTMCMTFDT